MFLTPLKDPVPRQLAAADFTTWVQNLLLSSSLLNRINPLKRPQAELQQVNLVFSRQTCLSSWGICLVIPEPAISSACLIPAVFLEYAKIRQVRERLCCQGADFGTYLCFFRWSCWCHKKSYKYYIWAVSFAVWVVQSIVFEGFS